ncbi:hypothetical protein KS4_10880 [Poriferisphaera corsica]|uniref:Uncharacterized protein n=1 Tax=Poriferisphaera corsica TaxID=2528020 RepID=A0A517YS34_9BACT|nr:hypothetical protein [Poriferisphaera corsica]QDU33047.1 hypothetical protein KS4_10880 [Poriferisphaera corsica]
MAMPEKKWLKAATLAIDPDDGALLVDITAPSTFTGGGKAVADPAIPEPLVNESTPCRFVWIAAPMDGEGNFTNTKPVFLGDSLNQNMPLKPSNYRGVVIRIDDASKIFVRAVAANEGVVFRITSEGPLEDNT